jgi:hypothetical protein
MKRVTIFLVALASIYEGLSSLMMKTGAMAKSLSTSNCKQGRKKKRIRKRNSPNSS